MQVVREWMTRRSGIKETSSDLENWYFLIVLNRIYILKHKYSHPVWSDTLQIDYVQIQIKYMLNRIHRALCVQTNRGDKSNDWFKCIAAHF